MAENAILEVFQQMQHALGTLEQALAAESSALVAVPHDVSAIAVATQRKQALVAEINGYVQAVDRCLAEQGLEGGRAGVESWLAGFPPDHAAHAFWQSILAMGQRCKEKNDVNGVQIGLLTRRTHEALKVLLGGDSLSDTYGPDGSGRISAGSRTFYTA